MAQSWWNSRATAPSCSSPRASGSAVSARIAGRLGSPDVLALEEVQDDSGPAGKGDGVVTSRKTLDALVEGIAAAGGPRYEAAWIDPVEGKEGGQPGGNIRVALLLNPARVTLVRRGEAGPLDATQPEGLGKDLHLTLSPGRVAPRSTAFTLSEGEGVGSVRTATFAGGVTFVETVHDWNRNRDLAFSIRALTDRIPAVTLDEHVTIGGPYFDVLDGRYRIEPLGDDRVVLHLTSRYRLSTGVDFYAGPWCDYVMRNIQETILEVIRDRCERGG